MSVQGVVPWIVTSPVNAHVAPLAASVILMLVQGTVPWIYLYLYMIKTSVFYSQMFVYLIFLLKLFYPETIYHDTMGENNVAYPSTF